MVMLLYPNQLYIQHLVTIRARVPEAKKLVTMAKDKLADTTKELYDKQVFTSYALYLILIFYQQNANDDADAELLLYADDVTNKLNQLTDAHAVVKERVIGVRAIRDHYYMLVSKAEERNKNTILRYWKHLQVHVTFLQYE